MFISKLESLRHDLVTPSPASGPSHRNVRQTGPELVEEAKSRPVEASLTEVAKIAESDRPKHEAKQEESVGGKKQAEEDLEDFDIEVTFDEFNA